MQTVTTGLLPYLADLVVPLLPRARRRVRSALVVRIDAIGDAVIWLPEAAALVDQLRRRHERVVFLANQVWAGLVEEAVPGLEVWRVDRSRLRRDLRYRAKVLARVRRAGFTEAIYPTISRELTYGDAIIRVSGAATRVASAGDRVLRSRFQARLGDAWYSKLIPVLDPAAHETVKNRSFSQALGIAARSGRHPLAYLADRAPSTSLPDRFLLVQPGASWAPRRWPSDKFVDAVGAVMAHSPMAVVLCGSTDELDLNRTIGQALSGQVIDLTGATPLPELVRIVSRATAALCNDSAIAHIAHAVGTPAVSIVGGGHAARFQPYPAATCLTTVQIDVPCAGCNWRCTQPLPASGRVACIDAIDVRTVIAALEGALRQRGVIHADCPAAATADQRR